jgi:hypothetical protein
MLKVKGIKDEISADEIASILSESFPDDTQEIEFETLLKEALPSAPLDPLRSSSKFSVHPFFFY